MTEPLRIQLRRTRGARKPPNTICVTRPGPFGNPYKPAPAYTDAYMSIPALSAADCVRLCRENWQQRLAGQGAFADHARRSLAMLRGRNLACWCHLCPEHTNGKPFDLDCPNCDPCHADALGVLANNDLTAEPEPAVIEIGRVGNYQIFARRCD